MKKSIYLLVALIVTTIASSQEVVKYSKSGFEAAFPTKPKVEKQSVDAGGYKIVLNMYLCEGDADMLIVSESQLPGDVSKSLNESNSDSFLTGTKNGAMNAMAAQLGSKFEETSQEFFKFQDFAALKVIGKMDSLNVNALFINRNGQLYQILVFGADVNAAYDSFVNSFKLI
ncbi:MAG: hypothetical protein JNJ52_13950 [Flavobacterium sp.]|nr:hypothetical protein [Flavobacterium sp.]